MKTTCHEFYKEFKCIADKCPDSCCKEWDVVVDDESYEKYNNVCGEFGEKLKSLMVTDADGDRIFTLNKNRCPFWNGDMLCDIYINLGEDFLCETCKRFPRINLDYTDFEEKILSLACPEALRLMLKKGAMQKVIVKENSLQIEPCDYDTDIMSLLLKERKKIFDVLNEEDNSLFDCLNLIYKIFVDVQFKLDGFRYEEKQIFDCENFISDYKDTVSLLLKLDIMTDEWKDFLENAVKYNPNKADITAFSKQTNEYAYEFKNLMYYYVFRYFLNSIDSYDVMECFNLMLLAVKSAYMLQLFEFSNKGSLTEESRHRIFGLYSKEVEHSYENIEKITSINSDFS